LWPHAAQWDREHHFPREAHQGLAALGAYGICVPEEFGGANLDYLTLALVLEEIAAGDGGTSTVISVTNCPVNAILLRYGNAAAEKAVAHAPGARRDAWRIRPDRAACRFGRVCAADHCQAGRRHLCAATVSSSSSPAARTAACHRDRGDRPRRRQEGHECFHRADQHAPVTGWRSLEHKLGQHSSDTAQISLENCRIPRENLIGQEGEGYRIALSALEGGRIGIAAQSVGMARSAFEVALAYAKERREFRPADLQPPGRRDFAWPIAPPASKPHAS
jgi:butyryl-CoA dehydrogenase